MYGGRFTSITGGVSIAGVSATGSVVNAQVDFVPTPGGAPGAGLLSWYINGVQVFSNQAVTMPPTFFVGFAASTGTTIEQSTLAVSATTPLQFACKQAPSPPSPPSPLPPPPSPPAPPPPPAPNAPSQNAVTMVQQGWVSWTRTSWQAPGGWFNTFAGNNTVIFGKPSPFTAVAGQQVLTQANLGLTNGPGQATAAIVSNDGQPFQAQTLCRSSPGSFSFTYAFSISAAQANTWNSLSDGMTLAFVDASTALLNSIPWTPDVSDVLVPQPGAVSLEIDTHDDACGAPDQPCTGTYTSYDNQFIPGAGTGYRLASPTVGDVQPPNKPLSDYVATNLMFGGTLVSTTNGTSIMGVAVTGQPVIAQVDFTATGPNGQGLLSWTVGGKLIFGAQQVRMPPLFWIGFAASTGGNIESASLVMSQSYPMTLFCEAPPPPAPPSPPPSPPVFVPQFTATPSCSVSMLTGSYWYKLCIPNGPITQQQEVLIGSGKTYTLGRTVTWNAGGYYTFSGGDLCGSVARSGKLTVFCGSGQRVNMYEPSACYYDIKYWTPAACAPQPPQPPQLPPPRPPLPPVKAVALPISTVNVPIYGPCDQVQQQIEAFMSPGTPNLQSGTSWSGQLKCAGFSSTYYVGDNGDNGASLSCYTPSGQICKAGDRGCPCWPPTVIPYGTKPAQQGQPGQGYCLVCPPVVPAAGPIHGACSTVQTQIQTFMKPGSQKLSSGTYGGAIMCQGFSTQYYVGDVAGSAGTYVACYNSFGQWCLPGWPGCGCVYPPVVAGTYPYGNVTNGDGSLRAAPKVQGGGNCVVCPLPTQLVTAPVYGNCTQVVAQLSGLPTQGIFAGQAWSGAITCAGYPNTQYWVGDYGDGGQTLACFDQNGGHCLPGAPGCPCQYPATPPYNGNTTYASYNNPGAGNCVICPLIPTPPMPPKPPLPPPPPPQPPPPPSPPPPAPMPTSWSTWEYTASAGDTKYLQTPFTVSPGYTLVFTINSGVAAGAKYKDAVSVRFSCTTSTCPKDNGITLTPSFTSASTTQAGDYIIAGSCSSGSCSAMVAYGTVRTS